MCEIWLTLGLRASNTHTEIKRLMKEDTMHLQMWWDLYKDYHTFNRLCDTNTLPSNDTRSHDSTASEWHSQNSGLVITLFTQVYIGIAKAVAELYGPTHHRDSRKTQAASKLQASNQKPLWTPWKPYANNYSTLATI